jgi:hypothetical protein
LNEDLFVELKGWNFEGLRESLDRVEQQCNVAIQVWTTAFVEELHCVNKAQRDHNDRTHDEKLVSVAVLNTHSEVVLCQT